MSDWQAETPDGRVVEVWRIGDLWRACCGDSEAESRLLDVAMMEAVRADSEVLAHERAPDLPIWVRTQAALIEERLAPSEPAQRPEEPTTASDP
jgi:hypothetical protein